jgi:hypothetical protein
LRLFSLITYALRLFGPNAMGAVMTGQGLIAVLVSLVQVLSSVVASHPPGETDAKGDLRWPTFGFVAAGAAFQLCACLLAPPRGRQEDMTAADSMPNRTRTDVLFALEQISTHPSHFLALATASAGVIDDDPPSHHGSLSIAADGAAPKPSSPVLDLFRRNVLANGSIALAFIVTLSVFPAVTAAVSPVGTGGWWREPTIWVPLGFLCFNGTPVSCLLPLVRSS